MLLEKVIRGVSGVESHLCNVISCRRTYFDLNVKNAFRKPETLCMPHTINAYYNPTANEMIIPMGFLQSPLLDIKSDLAVQVQILNIFSLLYVLLLVIFILHS